MNHCFQCRRGNHQRLARDTSLLQALGERRAFALNTTTLGNY
jgi:hypothetical protein